MNLDDVRKRAERFGAAPRDALRRSVKDDAARHPKWAFMLPPGMIYTLLDAGDDVDALLAEVERLRGALELIASHKGKTLLGEGTYSGGVHDGFNELASIARAALSPAADAKGGA